jgi:hypothetical protein
MNTHALVSALLLANPLSALAGSEVASLAREANGRRAALLSSEFRSKETYSSNITRLNPASGEWETVEVDVHFTLKFVPAGVKDADYDFDGQGELDYEVIVDRVDSKTGEGYSVDHTFFAKSEAGKTLSFFNCDSTKRCTDLVGKTKAYVFDAPEGRGLKLRNKTDVLAFLPVKDVLFFEVK